MFSAARCKRIPALAKKWRICYNLSAGRRNVQRERRNLRLDLQDGLRQERTTTRMKRHKLRRRAAILLSLLMLSQCMLFPAFSIFTARNVSAAASEPEAVPEQAGGMSAFALPDGPLTCSFTDVSEEAWYYEYVASAEALGLVQGRSGGQFAPQAQMTVAEAIVLSVRIYEKYHTITPEESIGDRWYDPYVARAAAYGILPEGCEDYDAAVRRDQAAAIFSRMLPDEELEACNEVEWIPDLDASSPYYDDVLKLYRAGVLVGVNRSGCFRPEKTATRAELVKTLCAVILPSLRSSVRLLEGNTSVFSDRVTEDVSCSFTDVSASSWYYRPVGLLEQLGIMNGVGSGRFAPNGNVTLAQALKVVVAVYEQYHGLLPAETSLSWSAYAVQAAQDYGILTAKYSGYNRAATRAEVVTFLSRCLLAKDLAQINDVGELPDATPAAEGYDSALLLYRAGVMRGSSDAGAADLELPITRAELAALLTRLLLPEERLRFTLEPAEVVTFHYGLSGSGRYYLTGYRIGRGENVMVLSFAIHGWEDHWAADGQELVDMADAVKDYLASHLELVREGNWSVYVLRCLNPDGLHLGWTNDGPGRCTTTRLDPYGNLLTDRGIDMNRCFPYRFYPFKDPRNFNGTAALQCVEAQKLAKFIRTLPQAEKRICIDVHGWLSEILATRRNSRVCQTLQRQFPDMPEVYMGGGFGYYSAWMGFVNGYDSVLLELPETVYGHTGFVNANCVGRFNAALTDLLKNY